MRMKSFSEKNCGRLGNKQVKIFFMIKFDKNEFVLEKNSKEVSRSLSEQQAKINVCNNNYENLNKILGTALPEVTESRYYSQTESERKTTITLKDLRHLIMWQLWITHFMDHYPNFHTEMERSYERGKFDQIGKLVFKKLVLRT